MENMTLFEDEIKITLNRVIDNYGLNRSKDRTAVISLQAHLRALPGSYAANIAENHYFFKGANIVRDNIRFQGKPIK